MGDFTLHIDIAAPPGTVFGYLADVSRTPEWYEAVRSVEQIGHGPVGEGTRFQFNRDLPQGRVVNDVEVSEYEEPTRIAFASLSGPTPFEYRYSIRPSDSGSTVTLDGTITGKGLRGAASLLAPLASKFFERGMAANLQELKRRLES